MTDAKVLVVSKKISSIHELLPALQWAATTQSELLIIADDFDNEVVATLAINYISGVFKVMAVRAPGFGDRRASLLTDICIVTGATLIDEAKGLYLRQFSPEWLGGSDRVVVTKDDTTLIAGKQTEERKAIIEERIKVLLSQENEAKGEFDKKQIREQRAKLQGGIVTIRVGGHNEMEIQNRKRLVDDAVQTIKAALTDGIVAGGGTELLRARNSLLASKKHMNNTFLEQGISIVFDACRIPCEQIIKNSGFEAYEILHKIDKKGSGFDVTTGQVVDMMQQGLVSPAASEKQALICACSAAKVFIMTNAAIAPSDKMQDFE
uniref:60 kDa chaperonin 3 n=1 Tax=Magallana gigas TaxID=29159 RepID=K1PVN2_MAGGI|eukprot:XP_011446292.1 PREDICTED: uncharacterized protein LOC105341444 [Crassostrea gigas]